MFIATFFIKILKLEKTHMFVQLRTDYHIVLNPYSANYSERKGKTTDAFSGVNEFEECYVE